MLVAVTGSAPAWRMALGELPIVRRGRWAVGGSASLALHGLPVDPRDLDLLVDDIAAAELVDGLRGAVVSDEARWDRGDVRAVRRALAVVQGVDVEILEGVEALAATPPITALLLHRDIKRLGLRTGQAVDAALPADAVRIFPTAATDAELPPHA